MKLPLATSLLLVAGLSSACQVLAPTRSIEAPALASAKAASDFQSYRLGRVGVLPVGGGGMSADEARAIQEICFTEFSERAGFELVLLSVADLEEVQISEPFRRGFYQPETVLGISRRYKLDGLLVSTVSHRQVFPPQKLNMQVDLVSSDTGMTIWSSAIALQADRAEVRLGVEAFYGNGLPVTDDSWGTALLSPSQFTRFGVWQMARAL